jgi:Domain of unknown function (DUF1707)/Cell wall-active antibiotics response 4TMS YvqF
LGMTELPDRRELRASDSDRDQIAAILREAAGDGRLSLDELDERLETVYAAKTYAELEPVVSDLPVGSGLPEAVAGSASPTRFGGTPTSTTGIGILSGFERKGTWVVPREFTAVAFWGGGEIDLRDAQFSEREVTIRAFAIMGGVDIVVPEDAEVIVNGIGIMGGFDHSGSGAGAPGAPRIIVTGFAFWGGVGVKRKRRKQKKKQQELDS